MSDEDVFPASYEQWRYCIEELGGISLTSTFINQRLSEMQDSGHVKTREFARLYGDEHLQQTIVWFRRAADEISR